MRKARAVFAAAWQKARKPILLPARRCETMTFRDRHDAGRRLAQLLTHLAGRTDVVILGLPRGGVPVAYEVAAALQAPLDIFVVRKLGVPGQEELALGALASGGIRVLNQDVVTAVGISAEAIDAITRREHVELERRERLYRGERPAMEVKGKTVVLIDDGLATGSTMRAAAKALRAGDPAKIVVAVPVAARATCEALRSEVDEVVCAEIPARFIAVGEWYEEFAQTTDDDVRELLRLARQQES
jgi:putative phosphoribosyl transferase